ncbi:hypothetical protein [Pedobacter paludis]|uniref:hypothetical protein n=1 Tax=Pedobacter paludis TaxID=2203212 RepID=UPI001314053B|nr:hypothetical protein [Pedobacter paludis]
MKNLEKITEEFHELSSSELIKIDGGVCDSLKHNLTQATFGALFGPIGWIAYEWGHANA